MAWAGVMRIGEVLAAKRKDLIEWASALVPPTPPIWGSCREREREREREGERERGRERERGLGGSCREGFGGF